MAGHSKWANTKHRKTIQDTKRGKIFTKIIRELVTAAKLGGSDSSANPRLRMLIEKALSNNMTRDTIDRAILRGSGGKDNAKIETIIYEGYGPGGSAIMVECLSNNLKRTIWEVRHAFTKIGGKLGTDGSVSYLFCKKGVISYSSSQDESAMMEVALKAGAEDVVGYDDGSIDVFTAWEKLQAVHNALNEIGLKADVMRLSMIPSSSVELKEEESAKLLHLINVLKNFDDVQEVYHNGKISMKVVEAL